VIYSPVTTLTNGAIIFLDRDGVLIEDNGLVLDESQLAILPGVPEALSALKERFRLVVVSNQAVVARGLLDEIQVRDLQKALEKRLTSVGAPPLDGFYFCPHHPRATLEAYRVDCDCRKPRPGLLFRAAEELSLDLTGSFMVGDRPTDILAGTRAGCRTVWVKTGQHDAALIETSETLDALPRADFVCSGLLESSRWILEQA
jgi:D-glycero-D-manno-heptose 1,7-bisphosphate phosphatase